MSASSAVTSSRRIVVGVPLSHGCGCEASPVLTAGPPSQELVHVNVQDHVSILDEPPLAVCVTLGIMLASVRVSYALVAAPAKV